MKVKKVRDDDDVPGDVLTLLGEECVRIMIQLINNINETGKWPKYFTEVTMTALKKKTQATKCSNHRTISLIAHTAKTVVRVLRRRIEEKIMNEIKFEHRKGTRDVTGTL